MKEYIECEARYIDANAIKYEEHTMCYGHGMNLTEKTVTKEEVDKIPTADVVEVCRCEKCQFGEYDDEQNMILCKRILNITDGEHFVYNKLDDFCSYGVRNEDRNEDRNGERKDK